MLHLCSAQASKFLQWIVCLPAGVLLQIYSVWSSLCGVHTGNFIISVTCSLAPQSVQLWLPASLMLGGNEFQVPRHTLMQLVHWHSTLTSDGVYLTAAVVL